MTGIRYSSWMLERIAIGDTVRLRLGTSTIGRHSSSVIRVLEAGFVSRRHAIFEVAENDEIVTITDVSSNGIFVNEQRYDKTVVQLKNNDLIGFGVSPINLEPDVDVTSLPIYKIKYTPLRVFQAPNATPKIPPTPNVAAQPVCEANGQVNGNIENDTHNAALGNGHADDQKPCCSAAGFKITNTDEIFEISDDDEDDDDKGKVVEKPQLNALENHKELISSLNQHIDVVIKSEPSADKDKLNPSQQKSPEKQTNETKFTPAEKSHNDVSLKQAEKDETHLAPQTRPTKNLCDATEGKQSKEPVLHVPIISEIKKEHLRSVSNDIKNIFGDIQDDIDIQKTIKQINPLILNEISDSNNIQLLNDNEKLLTNGAVISLTEEEDLDEVEVEELGTIIPNITQAKEKLNTIIKECKQELDIMCTNHANPAVAGKQDCTAMATPKSPNIFDSSLDNSKEELNPGAENENQTSNIRDNIDLEEYTKYVPHSDDEDVEDLMFSQVLINDMKAELQDDLNNEENLPLTKQNESKQIEPPVAIARTSVNIKQEPGLELFSAVPKELENSCWIISDDEEYDEELETKVNDWSNKIFSQNLSLMSQNFSQVYEMQESERNEDNDEYDTLDDDNLSLLEDDLDGIAQIYNGYTDPMEESSNDAKEPAKLIDEIVKTDDNEANDRTEVQMEGIEVNEQKPNKLESAEIEHKEDKDFQTLTLEDTRAQSPAKEITCGSESESPIVRTRRLSKTHPISESSSASSSEDEAAAKNIKSSKFAVVPDKSIPKIHPPVIEAPRLPRHKGKLRGVSADVPKNTLLNTKSSSVNKALNTIKEKMLHERIANDLKRKWLEKPGVSKKRERERKKFIKECRKDKLKELAERTKMPTTDNAKRKLSTDGHEPKAKVAKVKVTTHNRGAFLTNNEPTPLPPPPPEQKNQFKIPKLNKKTDAAASSTSKEPPLRSLSVDGLETFSQQIAKPDELLFQRQNNEAKKGDKKSCATPPLRRHSVTDTNSKQTVQTNTERKKTPPPPSNTVCKESIAKRAIRTTNKITFASMAKNIEESEENKRKLSELSAQSSTNVLKSINKTTSTAKADAKKKTVRFNDTPIIHYIERITGACKKIMDKDIRTCMTTYNNRRHSVRSRFSIVDHTNKIVSDILCWSNEWLKKRNAKADAAADMIFPMPTQFTSFEHYKSIILPLMKLEFVSTLEREYNETRNLKNFKVSLEYATLNEDRIILVTRFPNNQSKETLDSSLYDLVVLEPDKRGPQIFAFVVANRKGAGSFTTIVYEVIAKNFTTEYFKAINDFTVRPVMDRVRVHFGAFNSVYQLQSTPLFEKIINPLELLNCRPPPKKKVMYHGFDKLNEKQKQVLLNTYVKVIDESTPNITLIQGPPGTGKSLVITNLVLQSLYGEECRYLDKKILICAQSNAAVDVLALKLFDISMRMRVEKRFRLIRYGMLNKIHSSVRPIALQKVVERDQLKKLQARNSNMHLENKENLKNQILQFEAEVAEMSSRNVKGTVEEDVLIEKKRQLQLMRNILNGNMRPEDERSLFSWYLTNANIICATLSSCVNLSQYIDFFDICIIDEATQCTEPWTLLPLKFGINSLVLVGDTQQLPATVLSKKANDLGLGTSMFTRIQRCLDNIPSTSVRGATTPNYIIYSLQTQYRMHPEICRWPNQYFYRNELINAKETIDFNKSPLVPFCILSLTYTQNNTGLNGKITNNMEAEFVAKLLKALDGFIPNRYNSYGVITPYAHHRATLESAIRVLGLTNIMVNTIDSYQGLEKDVIVISNARTSGIGFLANPQRLNVALTRAKKCLIVCGNFRNLESVPAWRCLLESARERRLYHEISANCIEDIYSNVIHKLKLTSHNP